jgi:hypothetical protein
VEIFTRICQAFLSASAMGPFQALAYLPMVPPPTGNIAHTVNVLRELLDSAALSAFATCLEHGYDLGLHLNLTSGRSITSGPSISDPSGIFLGKVGLRESIKRHTVCEEDIAVEIQAQLRCILLLSAQCLISQFIYIF